MANDVVETLKKAKDKLTPETWFCGGRHGSWRQNGKCECAAVAIEHITESEQTRTQAFHFLHKAIDDPQWRSIMGWNDDSARTLDEVHTAYDRAISLASAS